MQPEDPPPSHTFILQLNVRLFPFFPGRTLKTVRLQNAGNTEQSRARFSNYLTIY